MEKQYIPQHMEAHKANEKDVKNVPPKEAKTEKAEAKAEAKPEKVEIKAKPQISKKDEAVARGDSIHASKKHCMYISRFIKGKTVDEAIASLERVTKLKQAVPFKGEIPHRKGMMSGRYPVNASKIFITILKGLKGNIIVNGMDPSKARIYYAAANWASRPPRSGGRRAKRAHVIIKAKETN